MAKRQKENYPNLPSKLWWQLREKFKTSIPTTISPEYIATALNVKESSARANVMPALIKLGFIDDNFKPKDRVYEWRDDDKYSKVCIEIIEEIYPEELREALPGPKPSKDEVMRWFANKTKVGENAARKMAIMYETLCEAKVQKGEELLKTNDKKSKSRTRKGLKKPIAKEKIKTIDSEKELHEKGINRIFNPSLHIDIQIHISPDSSSDQIDKIFSSMSKHIFNKGIDTDGN